MRVVVDSGPVIHLSWINQLDLLDKLFEEVLLPPAVREEVLAAPAGTIGIDRIQEAFDRGKFRVHVLPTERASAFPPGLLAAGEAAAIELARQTAG